MKRSLNAIEKRGDNSSEYRYFMSGVKELATERVAIASRVAANEAANSIRERERQAQLKAMSAIAERRLEEKYTETLVKLREECDFHAQ